MNRAVGELAAATSNLAGVALTAGYYDQAHFNRDFKEFCGLTPLAYRAEYDSEIAGLQ